MADGKNSRWVNAFINEREIQRVELAVEKAESATSAEIVTMIVRRSSTLGHVPFQVTLVLLLSILVFEIPQMDIFTDWNITWVFLLFSCICYGLAILIARIPWVQRLFIPRSDQRFQVEERAQLEFYLAGLTSTQGHTGVLIFVSLLERRAVVLADKAISEKLPPETWHRILAELIHAIKADQVGEGLSAAVHGVGKIVAPLFPISQDDKNELSNQLIIKE